VPREHEPRTPGCLARNYAASKRANVQVNRRPPARPKARRLDVRFNAMLERDSRMARMLPRSLLRRKRVRRLDSRGRNVVCRAAGATGARPRCRPNEAGPT
jgi:hypothetical protein